LLIESRAFGQGGLKEALTHEAFRKGFIAQHIDAQGVRLDTP
jgi:hypothetical protein